MSSAITTAVSGLNAHQRMLDVVGNNIANLNTIAYKARRVLFSDMLYNDIRNASGGSATQGSINPAQIGTGVKIAQVGVDLTQGTIESTGDSLDFAIDGDGFFMVKNNVETFYTRAGAFAVDETGYLIDPSTGYRVQRFGNTGETNGIDPGFQTQGDADIRVPLGTSIPGRATTTANINGNLKSGLSGPRAKVLTSLKNWTAGGAAATAATPLNSLDDLQSAYIPGDTITINGTETNGTSFSATYTVTGTSTLGDVVNAVNAACNSGVASIDANGRIALTADDLGQSALTVTFADGATNTGGIPFASNPQIVSATGKDGDTVQGGIQVYDSQGGAHVVNLKFEKETDGSWTMNASIDPSEGIVLDSVVERITFNTDGSFAGAGASGAGDINLTFAFSGIDTPQTLNVSFGDVGTFGGLTQVSTDSSIAAKQDGYAPGKLTSVQISGDGTLQGVASNGREFPLAQVAIASFRNPDGLVSAGDSYFQPTAASGDVEVGTALAGSRGSIRAGQLERSNVDVPQEFTDLIIAQRGFSANARTVTVASQVLEELLGIVR
jgi:flagellar hook protein FlgE